MLIQFRRNRFLVFSILMQLFWGRRFLLLAAEPGHARLKCSHLTGIILDAQTQEPIAGTQILLVEITRSGMSHADGRFFIPEIPLGKLTLRTFRIGYQNQVQTIDIQACDTNRVEIKLSSSPLALAAILVSADNAARSTFSLPNDLVMEGKKLRQQLGKTIAETIADEPGLDQRTMGPAPARPVLRGLGGDRLLLLEDGERPGDLSATAADHAVVIEPMTADRIEVTRGPAALMYGSNTLGGVVNVARGYIPTTHLDHYHGAITFQGETVNQGTAGGVSYGGPVGPFSWRWDGSIRRAGDLQTPVGQLKNTDLQTYNTALGVGLVRGWGYTGIAGSYYASDYGIPGGFVGAHPRGVRIELTRQHLETKTRLFLSHRWFDQLEIHGNYSKYYHRELESSGILGIEFGLLTYHLAASARLKSHGVWQNGTIGCWSEFRDYAAGGYAFTPPTKEQTIAGFYYQEINFSRWMFQTALRFDSRSVRPENEKISKRIGRIHPRDFADFSAAISGIYRVFPGIHLGSRLMRTFRAPGIEELFSEGPHLAAYSFEVGNPELGPEIGLALELFFRYQPPAGRIELALFRNTIADYIFPRNTGEINYRTLLPTYQFTGLDAQMLGSELTFEYQLFPPLALSGALSYVQGELTLTQQPLPWMPPLGGKLDLKYQRSQFSAGITWRGATAQTRLGEFEERTAGYSVFDLNFQYLFSGFHWFNSLDLSIQNLTNREYRKHLSRVKSIMPEPGRNIKVLYRIYL